MKVSESKQEMNQEKNSITKLINSMEIKDVADIFTNNDDLDGNNLTYSDLQAAIMRNLESKQLYNLH